MTWAEVAAEGQDSRMGDTTDSSSRRQAWAAHYFRHHSEEWEEFDSPQEAIAFLDIGMSDGNLSSIGVIWPDGTERLYDWLHDPDGEKMLADEPS